MQVILCAYMYANFFGNILLTILHEIHMLLKGSGLKSLPTVII